MGREKEKKMRREEREGEGEAIKKEKKRNKMAWILQPQRSAKNLAKSQASRGSRCFPRQASRTKHSPIQHIDFHRS
uniref:Uncharacterized protein n=1 Tax=Mustela putorius furo TaxID=9669 RepID=M3Z194_MUSPF